MCRKHLETKMIFMDCMKFRKSLAADDNHTPIPKTLSKAAEMTLCAKEGGKDYHNVKCIQRTCEDCGVDKFPVSAEESSENGLVKWSLQGNFYLTAKRRRRLHLCRRKHHHLICSSTLLIFLLNIQALPSWQGGNGINQIVW